MTQLIGAVMAVALLVSVAPVLAGDSFHALSRLPADLTPLDDAQLATVEGGDITALQSTTMHVSQSPPTSTSMHMSQNMTVIYSPEIDVAAAQALAGGSWATTQGNMAAVQEFLAEWLPR